eukprot:TRINITY_DN15516_c0_g1_i1.p2 TRINITY_DN15516_c0_g1~~TRINITY_DN15516_c0_g1_i1.p2  ORF type:complete len:113 (+),score=39.35 TRINITY_DN15516_c0_g1_i1:2-340(+)
MDPNMSQGSGGVDGNKVDADGGECNPDDVLKQYMVFVKKENMFQCTLCKKQVRLKFDVLSHMESVHFPDQFVYHCEFCGKEFSNRNKKKKHLQQWHKEKKNSSSTALVVDWP